MELIFELIIWVMIEVVFWGIMFWTGYVLTRMLTLGHWSPGRIEKDNDKKKECRREPEFIITAVIGALFWIVFCIALFSVLT